LLMNVECEVVEVELDDDGRDVEGVKAICSRCGHETESFGTGDSSRRRCLALMRDECPNGESNYYVEG
ncbi:MAG: hypothetical protein Q8S13_01340, partial [Dehalococcoidia bacterium]|nr:hypothetical protein [Dehalococcoidia bacterium]